jgi:hypothetical protein
MSAKKQELSKPSGQGLCFLGMRLSRYAAPQQNVRYFHTIGRRLDFDDKSRKLG